MSTGSTPGECRLLVSDGTIGLRSLSVDDTAAQLAGEDGELVRWLSGGRANEQRQRDFLSGAERAWREQSRVVDLGVQELSTGALAGLVGIQSRMPYLREGQVNLTYGLYPAYRRRGLATRAVVLAMWLARQRSPVREFVIRVHPDNALSADVARRAGFCWTRHTDDTQGRLDWYTRRTSS